MMIISFAWFAKCVLFFKCKWLHYSNITVNMDAWLKYWSCRTDLYKLRLNVKVPVEQSSNFWITVILSTLWWKIKYVKYPVCSQQLRVDSCRHSSLHNFGVFCNRVKIHELYVYIHTNRFETREYPGRLLWAYIYIYVMSTSAICRTLYLMFLNESCKRQMPWWMWLFFNAPDFINKRYHQIKGLQYVGGLKFR